MRLHVAALLVALTACGKKTDAPPPPPATVAPAALDDSACKLVSRDDALRMLGHPVDAGTVIKPIVPAAKCFYKADNPADGAVEVLLFKDGADAMGTTLKEHAFGDEPVQMPGIGTRAYRTEDSKSFGILAKGKFIVVSATSGAVEATQAVATTIAAKM
jgi:predicted small lipoprotein YifL